ncbi:hypothetical protein [Streptosporangium sp. G12]
MSTEHVLDAIDGALAWDLSMGDAMTWSPPEQEPPATPRRTPPAERELTRITVIIEQGDQVMMLEIPNPMQTELNVDVQEEDPQWMGVYDLAPRHRRETTIGIQVDVGYEGFVEYSGRQHVASVLQRIMGEGR